MKKKKMNAYELAEYVGTCWGGNDEEFKKCFSDNGVIDHPFFSEPVEPKIAMEVLNSTCRVNTEYYKSTLLRGDGEGLDDVIRMEFMETGDCGGFTPSFEGKMIVDAWIKDHEFSKFKVYGYDVVKSNHESDYKHKYIAYRFESIDKLIQDIAEAWMHNDMDNFISLFSPDAMIYHPIMNKPASPKEIADIINSGTKGVSIPRKARLIKGDGSGKDDMVDLYFEETGEELGYVPETAGLMHVTVHLLDGQIEEMLVHGYTPIKNTIGTNVAEKLFLKEHNKVLQE